MSDLEDAYRAGWLRGNVVVGCEPDWVDEDWVAYRDAREINRTQAERDAEVRAEGGDGTPEKPFRATYNPKCFQRHDAELCALICERDDGFEITVIPPRTGPTRHYRIDATGSWADLARPGEDKTVPMGRSHELKCEIREALLDLGLESVYAKGVADKTLDALEELETLAVTESAKEEPR